MTDNEALAERFIEDFGDLRKRARWFREHNDGASEEFVDAVTSQIHMHLMQVFVYDDAPPPKEPGARIRNRDAYERLAELCKATPGKWHWVPVLLKRDNLLSPTARQIRNGQFTAFKEGVWETDWRVVDGEQRIYARLQTRS